MNQIQKSELATCEAVIERGLKEFVEVGNALLKIRDGRLYRETHKTFEAYCKEKWGMVQQTATRMIRASEAVNGLKSEPIGSLPSSESIARPLTKLPPEAQKEVWKEAVETAPEGKVTARHVEETAKRWEPGTNSIRPPTKEAVEADSESDAFFQLKRWWKKAAKKDRAKFLRWVKSSGE